MGDVVAEDRASRTALGFVTRLALSLASAFLYAIAFPPNDHRIVALVAAVPLLLALRGARGWIAVALATAWSLAAMSAGITEWLVPAVVVYYQQSPVTGLSLLIGTTLAGATVEYVSFALCYSRLSRRFGPVQTVFLAASAWTGAELCRTRIGFGNPWGLFGYAVVDTGDTASVWRTLTQIADVGGVYAVTFVLVALNAALVEIIVAIRRGHSAIAARVALTGAALVAAVLAYGAERERTATDTVGDPVPVAIVQGNLDLGSQWREDMYGRNLAEYLELTRAAAETERVRMVFWPENAMTFFVDREPRFRNAIGRTTAALDVELVAGAPRFEGDGDVVYFNSVFVLHPNGEIAGRYDKRRLLPFGEYFPFGMSELLKRNFGRVRELAVGPESPPIASRAGLLGSIVCNEAMYPEDARERVAAGAEVLANLSNDSYVPGNEFAENQLRIAVLRAIEQRRYLVRASTSGPSAIVEPSGRVAARSAAHSVAVLRGHIAPSRSTTLYARIGDAFAWLCLFAAAAAALATLRTPSRRRVTPSANASARA